LLPDLRLLDTAIASAPVVRVKLVNGRTLWVKDVVEDDEGWLRATSSRGRDLLLSRVWVKAVQAA